MSDEPKSKYWLNQVIDSIVKERPKGELILSSGHSPSGRYHIGLLREFVTAGAIVEGLKTRGRQARHLDFVDDFDRLRKVPAGVPESFSEHLGKPLYLAPDPEGVCHQNYADHYFEELLTAVQGAGVNPEVIRSHQEYQKGTFTKAIEASLTKLDEVKKIIQEVGGRELEPNWVPVQLLSDNDRLSDWQFTGWDQARQVVFWQDKAGGEGELDYTKGRVKLDWRLDWPARWSIWGVAAEPFGRDHASAGGSYDTGKELVKQIFGSPAPHPIPYDFINIVGQTKKMSKSAGNVITPGEALDIMPAEILRYFVLRSRPNKLLFFDSGLGLYNLIDEYSKVESAVKAGEQNDFEDSYKAASVGQSDQIISSVPFSHLVSVYQAAQGNFDMTLEILVRTGYKEAVEREKAILERELPYVKNWLAKYAPESVKFEVQESLSQAELSEEQRTFLEHLAASVQSTDKIDGEAMHNLIYEATEAAGLKPGEAFKAIYLVILGKDSGPKAGWFLASLDHNWLIKRLKLQS